LTDCLRRYIDLDQLARNEEGLATTQPCGCLGIGAGLLGSEDGDQGKRSNELDNAECSSKRVRRPQSSEEQDTSLMIGLRPTLDGPEILTTTGSWSATGDQNISSTMWMQPALGEPDISKVMWMQPMLGESDISTMKPLGELDMELAPSLEPDVSVTSQQQQMHNSAPFQHATQFPQAHRSLPTSGPACGSVSNDLSIHNNEMYYPVERDSSNNKPRHFKLKESCDTCSAAKVKCSRAHPVCSLCRQRGVRCTYSPTR